MTTQEVFAGLAGAAFGQFTPPPKLDVAAWARKYRFVASGTSPKPGKFIAFPYQIEPMQSFSDPEVQVTVLQWASRTGKTEILNNLQGATIHQYPRSILIVYPTLDAAKNWRREFFDPAVEATPVLRDLIPKSRGKKGRNTTLHVQFPGGFIRGIGVNSPSGFRQIQAPVVIMDEIDAMPDTSEGDPVSLAFRRADNYADSVQVLASTPTIAGSSRIEGWLAKSDRRNWNVPCPKCGAVQILDWQQIVWPDNQPEKAELKCVKGCTLDDNDRVRAVRAGAWEATLPFAGIRGYWLNGINTLFPAKRGFKGRLHQFASEFLQAKHSDNPKEAIRVWVNTFKAEAHTEEQSLFDHSLLMQRREPYEVDSENPASTPLPAGVLLLTCGVDVQDNRLEAEIVGFGLGEETWGIQHAEFLGNPSTPDSPGRPSVWTRLRDWLAREFRTVGGHPLHVAAVCVDTGGHHTQSAYQFVRLHGASLRIWAVKGSSERARPIIFRSKTTRVKKVTLVMVGTDTAKEMIYSRLTITEPGPGYAHFPSCYSEEFLKQLVSEKMITVSSKGQLVKHFVKRGPNEALDLRVYSLAAFKLLNANLPAIAKNMAREVPKSPVEPEKKPEPEPEQKKPARQAPKSQGWGGWV